MIANGGLASHDESTVPWWRATDEIRFSQCQAHLSSAVLCDVMDAVGLHHQFLPPAIRPLAPSTVLVGRAMPVLLRQVSATPAKPFGRLTEALDQLLPGEVYLAAASMVPCASWGEILTATALARGARGAVIDGYHRDTVGVLRQNWPVFSWGAYGQDAGARSVVVDFRVDATVGGVRISPGDLIFGDVDGVIVVPAAVEEEILERAAAKRRTEGTVLTEISAGLSSSAAFDRYGVL